MINLPLRIQNIFKESLCPSCGERTNINGVTAFGIKEELNKKSKKTYLTEYFQYECEKCKKISVFSGLPTSFEDFIIDVLEISNSPVPSTADVQDEFIDNKANHKKGISDEEVNILKDILKNSSTHEEFLNKIGIDNKKKKIKKKNNDKDK